MSEAGRQALMEYAVFLQGRYPLEKDVSQVPLDIERPAEESVISAIRRLSETYPMLDRQALLHETSTFVMQHIVQGRVAGEVIDDLEIYFEQQYEVHIENNNADNT